MTDHKSWLQEAGYLDNKDAWAKLRAYLQSSSDRQSKLLAAWT